MATNQKIGETGWFYHAPRKQDNTEPQGAPPPSQIPGLGQDQGPYEEPRRPLLKESDSPYIRMAKMGGREDLLRIRDPKPKSEKPVGYPRVDWFYHEDNAEPAPENNGNYEFTLPDYMVHQGYNGNENPNYEAKRLPYAYDKTTAYEREGDDIRDKNFRIEEHQKPGYGVRNQRSKPQPPPPSDEQRYTPSSYQENKRQAVVNARGSGGVPYAVYSDDQLRAGQRKGSGIGPRQVGQNLDSTNLEAMAERRREAKANARRTSDLPYATIGEDDRRRWKKSGIGPRHTGESARDAPEVYIESYREMEKNARPEKRVPFSLDIELGEESLKDSSRIGPRHPGETGYQDPSFYLEMREAAKNNARPKKEAPFAVDGYRPGRRATPKLGPRHPGQDLTIDSSVLKERHAQALANAHRTTEAPFGTDPEYFHGYRNV